MIPLTTSQGTIGEELPMTMQVGMVGTDGVVIASDLKWGGGGSSSRETHLASKIDFNDKLGIGVACSEAEVSLNIAGNILQEFRDLDYGDARSALTRIGLASMKGFDSTRTSRPQCHCLVAVRTDTVRLYSLRVGIEGQNCQEILDKRRAGDPGNPAMFFVEQYYSHRPMNELVFLAAHMVLSASRFNPEGISGLEILLAPAKGEFRKVSEQEIEVLNERSNSFDATISRGIFS